MAKRQDSWLNIRVAALLRARLSAHVARRGESVSEWVRRHIEAGMAEESRQPRRGTAA